MPTTEEEKKKRYKQKKVCVVFGVHGCVVRVSMRCGEHAGGMGVVTNVYLCRHVCLTVNVHTLSSQKQRSAQNTEEEEDISYPTTSLQPAKPTSSAAAATASSSSSKGTCDSPI